MDQFKLDVVKHKLKDLFTRDHCFCIVDFKKICEAMGVTKMVPIEIQMLHCVHYDKMEPGMKDELFKRCMLHLANDGADNQMLADFIDKAFEQKPEPMKLEDINLEEEMPKTVKKTLLRRLLGQ